jgi:hypothetical protein
MFGTLLLRRIAIPTNLVGFRLVRFGYTWLMWPKKGHILRLLATHHIGKEISPNVFANNRLSSFVDSGKDLKVIKAK